MYVSGVDEAGRGPVIGPLVMAIVAANEDQLKQLKELDIKDSKLIAPKRRDELFDKVKEIVEFYKIKIISNDKIDGALNSPDLNLNLLELNTMASLVKSANKGDFVLSKAIMDCPSINQVKFQADVTKKINIPTVEVVAEHKADLNYMIVGAASILAKVTRDREIEKLKKKYNIDFGSGYPSDPKTRAFIQDNFDKYPIFRKTWATWKKVNEAKSQKGLFDF